MGNEEIENETFPSASFQTFLHISMAALKMGIIHHSWMSPAFAQTYFQLSLKHISVTLTGEQQ